MSDRPFHPDDPFGRAAGEPGETVPLGAPRRPAAPAGIPGLDFSDEPPYADLYVPGGRAPGAPAGAAPGGEGGETVRLGARPGGAPAAPAPVEEGRTVGYFERPLGAEPVVGWLVCERGPERGRDYRLYAGRNFVGRDPKMQVALMGDARVSRDRHAVVSYDPRGNGFRVAPGEGAGLAYLNGAPVDGPLDLRAYDRIEVGETTLVFVPLCSDRFRWDDAP